MYLGCKLPMDFNKLWLEGMKETDGTLSKRMEEDEIEEEFWKDFLSSKDSVRLEDRDILPLKRRILELLAKCPRVMEIGPGWGNYTYDIANGSQELTCLDISKAVLDFIQEAAEKRDINNINTIHSKFENFQEEVSFDAVVGVNCFYRMRDMKAVIEKMNKLSNKLCIIAMTSGPDRPHYIELNKNYGYEIKSPKRDYIYLYNIVYALGIDANVEIIDLKKDYVYDDFEQLIKDNTKNILSNYDMEIVKSSLMNWVNFRARKYIYTHNFKGVIIYWKV